MTSTTAPARRRRIPKRTVAVAAIVLGASTMTVALASPASADPTGSYAAVGSDTIQDVENGLANVIGGGYIASYDAFDPANVDSNGLALTHQTGALNIVTKPGAAPIPRPNGSGDGLDALRIARGTASHVPSTDFFSGKTVTANSIDIARSSSGPGGNAVAGGTVSYIPFALDAVTISANQASSVLGSTAVNFTTANLQDLYLHCDATQIGGVWYQPYDPDGTVDGFDAAADHSTHPGAQVLDLYLPQSGSGTAKFFIGTALSSSGTDSTADFTCVSRTEFPNSNGKSGLAHPGASVEEHDGSVIADDPDGIFPFSVAQWIAQSHAVSAGGLLPVTDRRHGAQLEMIDGTNPTTSGYDSTTHLPSGGLNTAFSGAWTREVYNVVVRSEVNDPTNAALKAILVSSSSAAANRSLLCNQTSTITGYGFAVLNAQPKKHYCGEFDDGTLSGGAELEAFTATGTTSF